MFIWLFIIMIIEMFIWIFHVNHHSKVHLIFSYKWAFKCSYEFLSSADEVSTGPTCRFLSVCLSVCLFVFPVFFSRRAIGWYTGFWLWFWQPTYPSRCSELGWAVPHSDFLAWLSSATLKNFISGVSSRILMR